MIFTREMDFPIPPEGKSGWPWTDPESITPDDLKISSGLKISIVTPSFNQGQFIEETIRSVLLQNYHNFEYIIIDGKSTDNSLEIIQKYQNYLSYWVSEPDRGQTHAINKGLAIATGDIVAYLNSDDIYLPGTFKKIINFFQNNPDIDMLYGDLVHIDKQSKVIDVMCCDMLDRNKMFSFHYYFPQASVFFRKEMLEKIGLFDENLHLNMDYDYWMRLSFEGKMTHIPQTLACARLYPEAKSQFFAQGYMHENLGILKKYKEKIKQLNDSDSLLSHAYASVYYYGGLSYLRNGKFSLGLKNIQTAIGYKKSIILDPVLFYSLICGIFGEKRVNNLVCAILRNIGHTSLIYHR